MTIAMVGQKGLPAYSGGVERHVDGLATRLVEAGNTVVAYCRKRYAKDKSYPRSYKGVELVYVPSVPTKHLDTITHTFLSTLHVIFFRRDVDVIHFHSIGPSFFTWLPRLLRPSLKVMVTYHCQDYFQGKWGVFARTCLRLAEWSACAFAHQMIVVSRQLQEYVRVGYGRDAAYIPNSVDLPERLPANLIREHGLSTGSYFLIVSRLVSHKGVHYAIEAYNRLTAAGVVMPKLVIAGSGAYTDEYVDKLNILARDNENVLMLGECTGDLLAELYSNAKLFIQPSESEGLSIALLEAMSFGCPVLVSDIAENTEVLSHVGRTFRNKNVDDLAGALVAFSGTTESTGDANRAHVVEYYEAGRVFNQSLALYAGIMSRA